MNLEETESLLAYGTLQNEAIQLATFGRKLAGQSDALIGYQLVVVEIEDQDFAASNGARSEVCNIQDSCLMLSKALYSGGVAAVR